MPNTKASTGKKGKKTFLFHVHTTTHMPAKYDLIRVMAEIATSAEEACNKVAHKYTTFHPTFDMEITGVQLIKPKNELVINLE